MSSFILGDGPTLGGWTQYAPLNSVGSVAGPGQGLGVVLWMISIALFCVGQLLGALNFITTTLDLRVKGMSMMRLPLTAWAWFITSCMGLTAFAVLMPACILVILDHVAGTSFFVPSYSVINDQLQPHSGGSTLLWQHLFWFFGHPSLACRIVPSASHLVSPRPPFTNCCASYCEAEVTSSIKRAAPSSHGLRTSHVVGGMNPLSPRRVLLTLVITIPATIVADLNRWGLYGSSCVSAGFPVAYCFSVC
jgi:cytochrome c oxidase subunit 1